MKANIEINDTEYLIRFIRENLNLETLSRLVHRVLNENVSHQLYHTGDIISRRFDYDYSNRFDRLEDK